ncbi:MAG TPA: hypothetical protein VLH38_00485 [Patescibacteria group bacterium]|nr:hypothetical protein [Patescibacteria group bacterium]
MADSLADVLEKKKALRSSIDNSSEATISSIETIGNKPTNNSIELPVEITSLITGPTFWQDAKTNRYRMLVRQGFLRELLELAEMAGSKKTPDHWFAAYASKANWERTLLFLEEARKVAHAAAEVIKRLGIRPEQMKAVWKACWKLKGKVVQHAITAQETGRDQFKYFCWLCWGPRQKVGV